MIENHGHTHDNDCSFQIQCLQIRGRFGGLLTEDDRLPSRSSGRRAWSNGSDQAVARRRLDQLRLPFLHAALLRSLGLPQVVLGGLQLHRLDLHALSAQPQGVQSHVDSSLGIVAGPFGILHRLRIMACFRKPSRCSAAVSFSSERPKPRRAYFRVAASSAISRSAVCFGMAFMLERLVMWR